jgi:hypothetical protein
VLLALVACAVAATAAAPVRAAGPAYLAEMPSAREVLAKTKGENQFDTWARQYATFERLVAIMGDLEGPREFDPTPSERRVASEYRQNIGRIQAQLIKSLPAGDPRSRRTKWFNRAWGYEFDGRFNRQLMAAFFSPSFRAAYSKAHASSVAAVARHRAAEAAAAKRALQPAQGRDHTNKVWVERGVGIFFFLLLSLVCIAGIRGDEKMRIRRVITLVALAGIAISLLIGFPLGILASGVALAIIALMNGMRFMHLAFLFGLACFPLAYFVDWWLLMFAFGIPLGIVKGQMMRDGWIFYPQRSFFFFWW